MSSKIQVRMAYGNKIVLEMKTILEIIYSFRCVCLYGQKGGPGAADAGELSDVVTGSEVDRAVITIQYMIYNLYAICDHKCLNQPKELYQR